MLLNGISYLKVLITVKIGNLFGRSKGTHLYSAVSLENLV